MKEHYRPRLEKRSVHKHATDWHRQVAECGTILRIEVGSGLHGTSVSDQDDRDEMGICIEPPEAVIGFRQFEQYEWKTAWERPGERENRSGPGDLDLVVYSLRKWARMALNGNPTSLLPMFAPNRSVVLQSAIGYEIQGEEFRSRVLSRVSGDRFIGYLETQRRNMLSHDGKGRDVTRPELIERYGFDTKFAGHMVRLGIQGLELMETGSITLPMTPADQDLVKGIRTGQYLMKTVLSMAEVLQGEIEAAMAASPLSEEPDHDWTDQWLSRTYRRAWQERGV